MKNPYKEIQKRLQEAGLWFDRIIEVGRGGEVVVGLTIYCPPILHEKRIKEIKDVIGNECKIDWLPNIQQIELRKL